MIEKSRPSPAHTDARGTITNLLAHEIRHVALIYSTPGSVRGNHFHRKDRHYTYLISGKASYQQRIKDELEETQLLPGDLLYTPAGVPHVFRFDEHSIFLAFTTESRINGLYELDTVPFPLPL